MIDGVEFCHWDRWLLRLALAESGGLDSIAREFWERSRNPVLSRDQNEAMLAQIRDLQGRLARLGRAPAAVLDAEEIASDWLFKKAWKRVWHDGPNRRTNAMLDTPRDRLMRRALRGHWVNFPISPATFETKLRPIVGTNGYIDYRMIGSTSRLLELEIEMLASAAREPVERLAVYRGAMTLIIETMNRIDDSLGDMAEVFASVERAYLPLAGSFAGTDGVLRDLLELAVWEDFGLIRRIDEFLRGLSETHADLAVRELAAMIAELRSEGLDYQLEKALQLRSSVLGAADALLPAD